MARILKTHKKISATVFPVLLNLLSLTSSLRFSPLRLFPQHGLRVQDVGGQDLL